MSVVNVVLWYITRQRDIPPFRLREKRERKVVVRKKSYAKESYMKKVIRAVNVLLRFCFMAVLY